MRSKIFNPNYLASSIRITQTQNYDFLEHSIIEINKPKTIWSRIFRIFRRKIITKTVPLDTFEDQIRIHVYNKNVIYIIEILTAAKRGFAKIEIRIYNILHKHNVNTFQEPYHLTRTQNFTIELY